MVKVGNRGLTVDREADKDGAVYVYLIFEMEMGSEWAEWSHSARERWINNFSRTHASDTYQGNIDYTVQATGYGDAGVSGEVLLYFPRDYWNDPSWTRDEIIDVGHDAVGETIKYELPSNQRNMIEGYEVKSTKFKSKRD